jgi:ankyrin repeat protein
MKLTRQPDIGTQLCFAVLHADIERTKQLLAEGADVNAVGDRRNTVVAHATPLWTLVNNAGMIGSEHWKEFISELGQVLPRVLNRDDDAKRSRQFQIVHILIAAKANLEALSYGTPPLSQAVNAGDLEMTQVLLASGANPNARCLSILSRLAKVERIKGPLGRMGYYGTVFHGAVQKSVPSIVEALLAAGADQSLTDHEGKTALDIALKKGSDEIVRILRRAQSGSTPPLK